LDGKGKEKEEITTWRIPKSLLIISEWDTPAMSVFATELVCGKCRNDMGAAIFEQEESSNHFTQSNNELVCEDCFQELKRAFKDSKTAIKER
jgi:hypothetical protein